MTIKTNLAVNIKSDELNKGHRKRMMRKLKTNGYEQFADYEIVELMLYLVFKRKDTKPLAKLLIHKFNTINNIINASENELLQIPGIGQSTVNTFLIIKCIMKAILKSKIQNRNTISCFQDVIDFCKLNMQNLIHEQMYIILLNNKNEIIDFQNIQNGTVDSVAIYPREIIKKVIQSGAKAFILVHNHPSGDPTPSGADILATQNLQMAADIFGAVLFDHIIIGQNRYISFKSLNLLNT